MKKVWQNTGWQILGRIVASLSSLVVTAFLTRLLSGQNYGNWIFVTTFTLLFLNFSDLGVSLIAVAQAARASKPKAVYQRAFFLKFWLALFSWLVFVFFVLVLPQFKNLISVGLIASLTILFLSLRMTAEIVFRTELDFKKKVFFESLGSLLFLLAIVSVGGLRFWPLNQTLTMVFWTSTAGVSSLLAFFSVRKTFEFKSFPSFVETKKLFSQSLPLGIRQLVFATYDQGIDNFFLKTFSTSLNVGFYGLSYKIYNNLTTTASFLMNSLFPLIARQNKPLLKKTFLKSLIVLFFSGVFLSLGLWFFSGLIIQWLAGPKFQSSVAILRILSLALVISFLNHSIGYTMIALGEQKKLLRLSLVALGVNLGGNLIFIPRWAGVGAAWITVATETTMFLLTARALRKLINC